MLTDSMPGAIDSVPRAARAMCHHCVKKAEDLRIVIDYLDGRISESRAIGRFNHEVEIGRRSGYVREPNLPCTREQGLRTAKLENAHKAREAYAISVDPPTRDSIRKDHLELKLGHIRLGKKYGHTVSVIRRVLGAR